MSDKTHLPGDATSGEQEGIFSRIWTAWLRIARVIGDLIARVVLSLFYFTVFVPFALGVRIFGDPLGMKDAPGSSSWLHRSVGDPALEQSRRQF
jgi:hypothetical protein